MTHVISAPISRPGQPTQMSPNEREEHMHSRYERCVNNSKRVRWDIDRDVIRGRRLDPATKFLPDSLSMVGQLEFLGDADRRLLSQIQGRTYANIFGLAERFINAKVLEISREHWMGDQIALEALVRFSDEELKHQELFRRVERLSADVLPPGYEFVPDPNEVATAVLSKSTWPVLALTCLIELFTQSHYKQSIAPDTNLSELYKDVFMFHWKEESQHAILDELEWVREDAQLNAEQREMAVTELIELVSAVDGILQLQSRRDTEYFVAVCNHRLDGAQTRRIAAMVLKAYRWQYIFSGIQQTRFPEILQKLITKSQFARIEAALATLA